MRQGPKDERVLLSAEVIRPPEFLFCSDFTRNRRFHHVLFSLRHIKS